MKHSLPLRLAALTLAAVAVPVAAQDSSPKSEAAKPAAPVAAYVPVVEHGGLLYVSGQLPFRDGQVVTGRLGEDVDVAGSVSPTRPPSPTRS